MSSGRRNYVTCANCRTMYDASGRNPRCPSCNERYDEREALPPLPPLSGRFTPLEGPHFERAPGGKSDTAPLSEFITAFVILGAFFLIIAAVLMRSPVMLSLGFGIMGGAALIFSLAKLKSMIGRRNEGGGDGINVVGWLFGRGYWGNDRFEEPGSRDRNPRNDDDARRGRRGR